MNLLGLTRKDWEKYEGLSKKSIAWQSFKGNMIPFLIGGPFAASLFAKDKFFRNFAKIMLTFGATAGLSQSSILTSLLPKLKSVFNGKVDATKFEKLTTDQLSGLSILAQQEKVKSNINFKSDEKFIIVTNDGNEYEINTGTIENASKIILDAKGVTGNNLESIQKELKSSTNENIKKFLKKLWGATSNSLPEIIRYMQESGISTPKTDLEPIDSFGGVNEGSGGSVVLENGEIIENKKINTFSLFGLNKNEFYLLGGLGVIGAGSLLYYAVKK